MLLVMIQTILSKTDAKIATIQIYSLAD